MRKRKISLVETIRGQHVHLSVAAHLARTQLTADPLKRYDGQHLLEMLDAIARALAKVAPLYIQPPAGANPRELSAAELEGASVLAGGQRIRLANGQVFASVSIKRADLRQAIALLKLSGVAGIPSAAAEETARPAPPEVMAGQQLARLAEMEKLLMSPLLAAQVQQAERLGIAIAREATQGSVANLSMRLLSSIHASRELGYLDDDARLALARLRLALETAAVSPPQEFP